METVAIHRATLYLLINNVAPCIHIIQPGLLLGERSLVASYPRGVAVHVHVSNSFMDINHFPPVGSGRACLSDLVVDIEFTSVRELCTVNKLINCSK